MNRKTSGFSEDKTERQRRKNLSDEQVEDLELAGGVEGGMPAGSGSPSPEEEESSDKDSPRPDGDRAA